MQELKLLMSKIRSYIRIGRPSDAVRPMLFFLLGVLVVGKGPVLLPILSLFFLSMAVVAYNDICDYDIDRISNKQRPLMHHMSIWEAQLLAMVYAIISLILLPWPIFPYWLIIAFLGFAYSRWKLSYDPFLAAIILILCNIVLPLFAGEASITHGLPVNHTVLIFAAFFALLSFCVGPYKDYKDIEGDRGVGKRTFFTMFKQRDVVFALTIGSTVVLGLFIWWLSTFMDFRVTLLIGFLMLLTQLGMLRGQMRALIVLLIIEGHALLLAVLSHYL